MTEATTPKLFTKDEIKALELEDLEKYAVNLKWPKASGYGWRRRQDLSRYKTRGFPPDYDNVKMQNRTQFLRRRLLRARQEVWNPDAKAAMAAEKKRLAELEAKKPKVSVRTEIVIELKDHRPNGHTFTIRRSGKHIICQQKTYSGSGNHVGKVGQTVCNAKADFSAQDFEDAVNLISEIEMPKIRTQAKGKAKLNFAASVVLEGVQPLSFSRNNGIIGVRQYDSYQARRGTNLDSILTSDWQFKSEDLLEVIKLMKSKFKVVPQEVKIAKKA